MERQNVELRRLGPAPRKAKQAGSQAPRSMDVAKRRAPVAIACNECRRKKVRCDGKRPVCSNCDGQFTQCAYRDDEPLSQQAKTLVIETIRLLNNLPAEELVRIVHGLKDEMSAMTIVSTLRRGSEGHQQSTDNTAMATSSEETKGPQARETRRWTSSLGDVFQDEIDESCFRYLQSWGAYTSRPIDDDLDKPTENDSTPSAGLSFQPQTLRYHDDSVELDTWTRNGLTKTYVLQLFDTFFEWKQLPVSIVSQDLFLRDYKDGSDQFCSTALVHAILALATRLNGENGNADTQASRWLESESFFGLAKTAVEDGAHVTSLPNIQALGVLSLYSIRCAREAEACKYADIFTSHIASLYNRLSFTSGHDEQYLRAHITTYCGAVTLARMLQLTTGRLFDLSSSELMDKSPELNEPLYSDTGATAIQSALGSNLSRDNGPESLVTRVGLLTEWVYRIIHAARSTSNITSVDVIGTYTQCLDWYNRSFAIIRVSTPLAIFTHMFYHFCILCIFRALSSMGLEESNIQPRELCMQAAQSILALAQSYDGLFTLRRVPGFMPYLVCAAGLVGLAIEGVSLDRDPVQMHGEHGAPQRRQSETLEASSVGEEDGILKTPPAHDRISTATHARFLLARMSATYPILMEAERMIEEAIRSRESATKTGQAMELKN